MILRFVKLLITNIFRRMNVLNQDLLTQLSSAMVVIKPEPLCELNYIVVLG